MRIILFNINIFKQTSIHALCRDLKCEVSVAVKEDLSKSIGEIAGLKNSPEHAGKPLPFDDEMIVFCGAEPDHLDRFLEEYRKREIPPVKLKAILTPYNAAWTPGRLCMELRKENAAMANTNIQSY